MELSIIIVNWKSVEYLRKCLQTVYANANGLALETIVVDNASGDGCEEVLRREFPQVVCIASQVNLGFAGANNLGFAHSSGRKVLFLNPDTEVVGDALQKLISALEADATAGMAGALLLNTDGSIQTSCITAFPTILNQVLDAEALRERFPKWELWGMKALYTNNEAPVPVDGISGACMMLKREVFEYIGGFSTQYFMYSEDVDLSYRVRRSGLKNVFVKSAVVVHHGGKSSSKEPQSNFAVILMRESRYRLLTTWRGRSYATAYRAATATTSLLRLLALQLGLIFSGRSGQQGLRNSTQKWSKIFRWSIGLESWAKELRPQGQQQ